MVSAGSRRPTHFDEQMGGRALTMNLQGKTAIVTGGGTGIGEAVSMKLAARGANVVINYRSSAEEADRTAARCLAFGVRAIAAKGDVGEDQDCRRLAQVALDLGGTIDMLVNNAGATKFAAHSDLDALSADDFRSEEHTSELQSLMRISYAVFCLTKKQ